MLKALVTGGAGFIGSNLVRYLLEQQYHVLNLDALTYAGNLASLADVENHAEYEFLELDITDRSGVNAVFSNYRPDLVFHLAAESHVDRSIDSPHVFIETNVIGTLNLLQASLHHWEHNLDRQENFRFLHVSTDEVYGSLGPTGLFTEETRYDPRSPYSASKASSDHLVRAWHHTYGLPVVLTNCSNNYGPYQFPEKLIPVVILKCLNGQPIPIYGKGENVRDWLFVTDHCSALECVAKQGQLGETYNVGGNNELRNIDLVNRLCNILNELAPRSDGRSYAEQITFVADRPGHDARYAIDSTKLQDQLGWKPNSDHEALFRQTVQWYLDHRSWWEEILSGDYRMHRQGLGASSSDTIENASHS